MKEERQTFGIITLATGNDNKLRELSGTLIETDHSDRLTLAKSDPGIEETGTSFLANARQKADATQPVPESHLVLAEDSGLVVEALAGLYGLDPFPGIYSNRWLTPAIRQELLGIADEVPVTQDHRNRSVLKLMESRPNRQAAYVCGMTLLNTRTGEYLDSEGRTRLAIVPGAPRGQGGFGYDPVTIPVEMDQAGECTTAEISPEAKNRISHRGRAFRDILSQAVRAGWLPT